jgi:hypothetical protein
MSHEFRDIGTQEEAKRIFSEALGYLWTAPYVGIDKDYSLVVAFRLALAVVALVGQCHAVVPPTNAWTWMMDWQLPLTRCLHELSNASLKTALAVMLRGIQCVEKTFERRAGMAPLLDPDDICHEAMLVDTALGDGGFAVWVRNLTTT